MPRKKWDQTLYDVLICKVKEEISQNGVNVDKNLKALRDIDIIVLSDHKNTRRKTLVKRFTELEQELPRSYSFQNLKEISCSKSINSLLPAATPIAVATAVSSQVAAPQEEDDDIMDSILEVVDEINEISGNDENDNEHSISNFVFDLFFDSDFSITRRIILGLVASGSLPFCSDKDAKPQETKEPQPIEQKSTTSHVERLKQRSVVQMAEYNLKGFGRV